MHRYLVVFEKTSDGYSAYVPDLPGCIATGPDKESTEKTIYDSIKFHLEGLQLENNEIPAGTTESEILVFN
ncbi:MAG: type II toxin-antitoxin system HicB family antitoxin [Spirochaetales bacterium]|nr:type II toxin-antitoxin system HicB family antitoxin [Spirochaetales bacterium]